MSTASIELVNDAGKALRIAGDWTLPHAESLRAKVATLPQAQVDRLDAAALDGLDTSGAMVLGEAMQRLGLAVDALSQSGLDPADVALVQLVLESVEPVAPVRDKHSGVRHMLERIGRAVLVQWKQLRLLLGFVGLTLSTLASIPFGRRKLRYTATVFHMEQTGLDAVPIVALLTFMVGAVIAFLGATVLRDFGAEVFTVELVSYSFLREFGVLLTAILLAGRSGSAFTAQIGSMNSREELDAIRALGLDPIELLVLPRLIALMVMLPLLAFIAMIAGIVGGGLVASSTLDISPGAYINRLYEMTEVRHFWVGMVKAPFFAFLIAVVGCLEGFKVEGSAESVGQHTTSSVVQSIFLVILFDAIFAIFFMELGV
jgi:phospholipid/cholesterol/gamma-HCH transport system permease protein